MKKLNLVGQKYGRLTVIREVEPVQGKSRSRKAYECKCDCGTIKVIKMENLRDGSTKSCGCLNEEQRSARAYNMYSANIKYTPSETSARRVWRKNYNEMPFEDFYELSQRNCFYCGIEPNNLTNSPKEDKKSSQFAKDNGNFIYNGLDRKDNTQPHSKDNCVACCKWCNYSKRERTMEEFREWIVKLHKFFIK